MANLWSYTPVFNGKSGILFRILTSKTMIERLLKVTDAQEESVFLFGARQTGKTTLLLHLFPGGR